MRTCPECLTTYDDEVLHCPEDGRNLTQVVRIDELVGRTVGSYKVTKLLGKGGMGAVYIANHPVIGSRVAIKVLHPEYSQEKKIVERFFNEARAVNIIGHDNVLKILDLNVTDDNRHYFVMEYLQGRSLQALVQPDQPLDLDTTGPILLQTCNALAAAHNRGIIHRDLKPDNIYLIVMQGRRHFVKVVDFGIARLTNEEGTSTGKTQSGMVMGTPAYMSPEQGSGQTSKIDARSDIYSLGVMMYQMATGRLPFPGTNFGEVLIGHLQKPPPSPRGIAPAIPEDYEAVILKCLAKAPEDRYQSMEELHDGIFEVMQAHGISAELPFAEPTDEMDPLDPNGPTVPNARMPSHPSHPSKPPSRAGGTRQISGPPRMPASKPSSKPSSGNQPRTGSRPNPNARPGPGGTPEPEKKPKLGLMIGIAAAALVAISIGYAVHLSDVRDEEANQRLKEQAEKRRKERAAAAAAEEASNDRVNIQIDSAPPGANVNASWPEGAQHGITPYSIEVPRNTKVHFDYAKDGFAPFSTELIADQPQTVSAVLRTLAAEEARPEPKKRAPHKSTVSKDGLIDLDADAK